MIYSFDKNANFKEAFFSNIKPSTYFKGNEYIDEARVNCNFQVKYERGLKSINMLQIQQSFW